MILSPASKVDPARVDEACRVLLAWGFVPMVSECCKGECGTYSAPMETRLAELIAAFSDDSVRAILCSRGGYGMVQLIEHLPCELLRNNPKWVIGFSDISALHAAMHRAGVASIHASMAKALARGGEADELNRALRDILMGQSMPSYDVAPHKYNRYGEAQGRLVGGNLAVLSALIGTEFDLLSSGDILFIENVAEPVYKVERMMYQLKLSGILGCIKGLIVGAFTHYTSPDANGKSAEDVISAIAEQYSFPMAFGFPVGHIDENVPLIEGGDVVLTVTPSGAKLKG